MVKKSSKLKSASKGPRVRISIGAATALGPGKVGLLQAIHHHGSISGAAREMGMSYRRAWMLVDTMNSCFTSDLIVTSTGGKGGGGAVVTPLGLDVIARYQDMETKAAKSVEVEARAFAKLLKDPSKEG
jgi:molybdate transport system regulatory protein